MSETNIKISSIIESQLPSYVAQEYPLVSEFLSEYYRSQEFQGGSLDILKNISKYIKVDNLTNLVGVCTLTSDVTFSDNTIYVDSTYGFPETYGLLKIDSEIVTYKSKTQTSFNDCVRGFSGIISHKSPLESDLLQFSTSEAADHSAISVIDGVTPTPVENLSILFLTEFLRKTKRQFVPGFEDRELYGEVNDNLFIKQSKDFYSSKGTDSSFKILFEALYGEKVEVVKPKDQLFKPSDAQYRIGRDLVVEAIEGDPLHLINKTIYQDETSEFTRAQGTVFQVEKILRDEKEYYVISVDYDYNRDINVSGSVFGKFSVHPKTQIIEPVDISVIQDTINVDSTAGFPNSGELIVILDNGGTITINYGRKTLNQFLDCTGIIVNLYDGQEIRSNAYAYGYSNQNRDEVIKFRITGVLSNLNILDNTFLYEKDNEIDIKTLGYDGDDIKSGNWFFNIVQSYDVRSVQAIDPPNNVYKISTYDIHKFNVGDSVSLISSIQGINALQQKATVIVYSYEGKNAFVVKATNPIDLSLTYKVKRNLSKVNCLNYQNLQKYTSDVQNIYSDLKGNYYVTSPSLPTYLNQGLYINDRSVTFSGSFDSQGNLTLKDPVKNTPVKHYFYTGDSVVYTPKSQSQYLKKGLYFVKKIDEYTVRLAYSRTNIDTSNFIILPGVMDGKLEFSEYTYADLTSQTLEPQKLIRKLSTPQSTSQLQETPPGPTGILVNGVEILNYKSKDSLAYGPLTDLIAAAPGDGYDVITPPILEITDDNGSGANGYCCVNGSLKRIDILDQGFDYLDEPNIIIKGGNGSGAVAKAKLVSFEHISTFNSEGYAQNVDLNDSTIVFGGYHKFRDNEFVIYDSEGQTAIGGLVSKSQYYVRPVDEYKVKLYASFDDSVQQTNQITFTSYGVGNHVFKSIKNKQRIGSITISNPGFGYQNRKATTTSAGINTASNSILIKDHGYDSGQIVVYTPTGTPVLGLSSGTSYYVTKLTDDEFRLSQIGIGTVKTVGLSTLSPDFYYASKQYINLNSIGSGLHQFNYPPITVEVKGNIGISSVYNQDFNAKVQPIFRGGIDKVFLEDGGSSYGTSEIINYEKQPSFKLKNGSGALLKPVINNGSIVDVLVQNIGVDYNCPPDLVIEGDGYGALLTPIIEDGYLTEVKVIHGGLGYNEDTTRIIVASSGQNVEIKATITKWRINVVERSIQSNQITDDDGFIDTGINDDFGLQYTHAYAPRKLRSSLLSTRIVNGIINYIPDLQFIAGKEVNSDAHSPIIGWAYDGNPIYGPYGYSSRDGGQVRSMVSSYILKIKPNRPSTTAYPLGVFVEDYDYNSSGDLDQFNGRFCKTPEYPNGVYAYFCTISNGNVESAGIFQKYKKPVFPYIIGNYYKSKPIDFNFNKSSNQDDIDINKTGLLRNTNPYNLLNTQSTYDYIFRPYEVKKQFSEIKGITKGRVDSIGIVTGGFNYKIGDKVVFNNKKTTGNGVSAEVSQIKGKKVNLVSTATSVIDYIEFIPTTTGSFVGFATIPHGFNNRDLVSFTGFHDYKKYGTIKITNNQLVLRSGVASAVYTGLVTYFDVFGSLSFPNIRENDFYQIGDEQVKILNIDLPSSRVRVIRNQNGTVGVVSYSSGIGLTEVTRKLQLNFGISTSYNFISNKEVYFNPQESVGIGLTSGVGIAYSFRNYTLNISNPGVGATQITIPTQTIYLPNHQFDTGTPVIYSTNGGTPIGVSTNGIRLESLVDNSTVYIAKVSNDLVGISTVLVGLDTNGNFVGVGSTPAGLLYFRNAGSGLVHSFKTNFDEILSGDLKKNVVTVTTEENHELSLNDNVVIDITAGITTTIKVIYDDYNRRLVINPRSFTASDVDITKNTITIPNHRFNEGQKVIYRSASPSIGLVNESIYFVVVVDSNKIKLAESYYKATKENPVIEVEINSQSSGLILPVNPPINVYKNNQVLFDLSDNSLSYNKNFTSYSAFDFNLYKDSKFKYKYEIPDNAASYQVYKNGRIGIDTFAALTLAVNSDTPQKLYYNLDPVDIDNNLPEKLGIFVDDDSVLSNNKLSFIDSVYNGSHTVAGIASTTFTFNILNVPEDSQYVPEEGSLNYYTNSLTAKGAISNIELTSKGERYNVLPDLVKVNSVLGKGAILECKTNSIGQITKTTLRDIGFDYPTDLTLRPTAKLPSLVKIQSLYSLKSIGITSTGRNYITPPDLLLFDGFTQKRVTGIDIRYRLKQKFVTILQNTTSLYNSTPRVLPINNSNGIKIKTISYDKITKDVTVTLAPSYSDRDVFPFEVGDNVMIEHTSVGIVTTGKGYNTENYDYRLFTIKSMDPNIGGANGSIVFNIGSFLKTNEYPGTFDSNNSSGTIVPEKFFPVFNPILRRNNFLTGEKVTTITSSGIVNNWNPNNNYLKILESKNDFNVGELITGNSSGTKGIISEIIRFNSVYDVEASSIVRKGWNLNTGFLSDNLQRLHDSEYYQNFSYSLKSKVPYETWNPSVSVLNHTSGFKKFSDLIIESIPSPKTDDNDQFVGMQTAQNNGYYSSLVDAIGYVDTNCVYDFDLVKEKTLGNTKSSDNLVFNSRIIQDYVESIGNRVLILDDLSKQFNSNPRPTKYTDVDTFNLNFTRSKKYFAFVQDRKTIGSRQANIVTLIHNNKYGFLSQYAVLNSQGILGYYDFSISGDQGSLNFYPVLSAINNYDLGLVSLDISDSVAGVGSTSLGTIVKVDSSTATLTAGLTTSIPVVGIASTYRASKILVSIAATNKSYFEYNEISLVHDGTNVNILEYGKLNTDTLNYSSTVGLGTYDATISGSNVYLYFKPNSTLTTNYILNTIRVSIGNTQSTISNSLILNNSRLDSKYVAISSSASPTAVGIASYPHAYYQSQYLIASIEDKTNKKYQLSEIALVDDDTDTFMTEYGITPSNSQLGTFTSSLSGNVVTVYFTPNPNIATEVRIFSTSLGIYNNLTTVGGISIGSNAAINAENGVYIGNELDIKKQFPLSYNGNPVFKKTFDGSSTDSVDLDNDQIKLSNHYFTTGERVKYSFGDPLSSSPVGIATTTISGITTNTLPSTLYIVKLNESYVRVAASSTDALSFPPKVLNLSSVGIGTVHSLTSYNQNTKCIIAVDNVIQSPIVGTAVTTSLAANIGLSNESLSFSGITSFFGGDLIQVDDEIMRINSIGIGLTNTVVVQRPWLGTGLATHSQGAIIKKITGNYNIVDNDIVFAEAPYGQFIPPNPFNSPDEVDYTGLITSSTFGGRVFLRSGAPNSVEEAYTGNYVFDDVSDKFSGFTKTFTLKSNSKNVGGISTGNAIVLINDVFQGPVETGVTEITENYYLTESSGITSVTFTGAGSSSLYDINNSSLPRGGIIVTIGSTAGYGYQPLVAAGGTAILNGIGSITSISIGNSGSGYRVGIQTVVRVGVQTLSVGTPNIKFIGTASVSNGRIVSVAVTNPGIGYTNYSILDYRQTSSVVSSGSTIIPLSNTSGITAGNYISVGIALTNVYIVGVGSTAITIGTGSTINTSVSTGTTSIIKYYNPPKVIFDPPASYTNIPLIYSSKSRPGIGTQAKIDIVVGQGSSIISFEIKNYGYAYGHEEILTVGVGGTVGIPTDPTKPFNEFTINVDRVFSDKFSAWSLGQLQVLDPLDDLFDGVKLNFPITLNNQRLSITSRKGSLIDVKANLLIFINGTLQLPGVAYDFTGGSNLSFVEAPKAGDSSKILFYKGTANVDTLDNDILEPIEVGDTVTVVGEKNYLREDERLVTDIISTDEINTNVYTGPGVSLNQALLRPITLCRQTEDRIVDGKYVSKSRIYYEPLIYPTTNIIQNIGITSTVLFVENVRGLFDNQKENTSTQYQSKIEIVSQDSRVAAYATAFVSIAGTITSFAINDGGVGYTTSPVVTISGPIGFGTTGGATATAYVSNGSVTSMQITNPGTGYTFTNPPSVLIQPPILTNEIIKDVSYLGDFGTITQVRQTSVAGLASTGLYFNFFIPLDSHLRENDVVGTGITISQIQPGYYFTIRNSKVGTSVTSLRSDGTFVGTSKSCIDTVYQVLSSSTVFKNVAGVGLTAVQEVLVGVSTYNGYDFRLSTFDSTLLTFDSTSKQFTFDTNIIYYGNYSWGRITANSRSFPESFTFYGNNGISGISSSAILRRYNPLRYLNYN